MKLLVLTQKVDINDDLLGFFHDWLEKLAGRVEKLYVIALGVGVYRLPANVEVFSLGKERHLNQPRFWRRLMAIWRFYFYLWRLRRQYNSVFVHMNVEYVILAGWLWRLFGKKLVLWYAHYRVDWRAKWAFFWVNRIVTSTINACRFTTLKLKIIGQGIDLDKFKNIRAVDAQSDEKVHILYLGRISRIKNLDLLLRVFSRLSKKNPRIFLDIVGAPTPVDGNYFRDIQRLIQNKNLSSRIKLWDRIPNYQTVDFYNRADLYVNLTPTGSFDKTSLEAMACQTPTIVSNRAFYEYFDQGLQARTIFKEGDENDLFNKISAFLVLPPREQRQIGVEQREMVSRCHSLKNLVYNLIKTYDAI